MFVMLTNSFTILAEIFGVRELSAVC